LAIAAVAAVGFGPIASRADAPAACPATAASTFSENGAEAVLTERSDKRPLRILAIGSSSTQGIGASSPGAAYPAQLETRLEKDWGIAADVVNAGVGGEPSDTTLKRLLAALAEDSPGVAAAQAHRVPVVLVDPQFYFGIRNLARFQQYVNIIADVGAARRVPVFSRFAMMRAWAKSSAATLTAALSPDGFHMDDRGYACFADALADDLVRQEEAAEPAETL